MEKLQKYCLSVLLVIISSNISAQISNGTVKSEDCKALYEIYNQFLNLNQCQALGKIVFNGNSKRKFSIGEKQNAADLFGDSFNKNNKNNLHKDVIRFSEERHNQQLIVFLKETKKNFIAEVLYFKSKVSKIRNKDYLVDLA